ncbi:hypothetical protein [Clostridium sp. ZBS15]|uniref:hypothetical protein n=1 Tax=Clostridium sp. ZBS15 TaxID=2949969 RepID=UPI002079D8C5|nr:hypothetical protein [Clostridium sp. ZBS15]
MNELLIQLKHSLGQAAVLGTKSLSDDFRLKKISEKIKLLSSKAQVFSKIYSTLEGLLNEGSENTYIIMCELVNLINAVLYTQGNSQSIEKEEKFEIDENIKGTSVLRYSEIRNIKEILKGGTTTKWASLKKAFKENKLFDYRLLNDLLGELSNSYVYEYDFSIVTILSQYNEDIVHILMEKFEKSDKVAKCNIVKIISNVGKEKYNNFYKKCVLEEDADNVISAAIKALKDDRNNEQFLLDLKLKKKALKEARILALACMDTEKADEEVKKYCLKNIKFLNEVLNERLFIKEDEIIELIEESMTKEFGEKNTKDYEFFYEMLDASKNFKSKRIIEVLKKAVDFEFNLGDYKRNAAVNLFYQNDEAVYKYLFDLKKKSEFYIGISFAAAQKIYSKEEIFEEFSKIINKKFSPNESTLSNSIKIMFNYYYMSGYVVGASDRIPVNIIKFKPWDERWVYTAMNDKNLIDYAYEFVSKDLNDQEKSRIKKFCLNYIENMKNEPESKGKKVYYLDTNHSKNICDGNRIRSIMTILFKIGAKEEAMNNVLYFSKYFRYLTPAYQVYMNADDITFLENLKNEVSEYVLYDDAVLKRIDCLIDILALGR